MKKYSLLLLSFMTFSLSAMEETAINIGQASPRFIAMLPDLQDAAASIQTPRDQLSYFVKGLGLASHCAKLALTMQNPNSPVTTEMIERTAWIAKLLEEYRYMNADSLAQDPETQKTLDAMCINMTRYLAQINPNHGITGTLWNSIKQLIGQR